MFMERNRALNGADQPEEVLAEDSAQQRAQERLNPVPTNISGPQKRTFEPDLSTLEEIANRHKMGGLVDAGNWADYSAHIPVGPMMP